MLDRYSVITSTPKLAQNNSRALMKILLQPAFEAAEVLFLSDVEAELDAAKAAGLELCTPVRDGQAVSDAHPYINDFSEFSAELLA